MEIKANNKKLKTAGLIGLGVFIAFFNFIAGVLIIKFGWSKIAYILLPGLVKSGAINASITFMEAFTVGCVIYFLAKAFGSGVATINTGNKNK